MLKIGTQVKMTSLDKFGFTGRERHPTADHVGSFQGTVVDAVDATPDDDDRSYCYLVCNRDGDCLELMHDEVTVLDPPTYAVVRVYESDEGVDAPVRLDLATTAEAVAGLLRDSDVVLDWSVFELVGGRAVHRAVTFSYERVLKSVKIS